MTKFRCKILTPGQFEINKITNARVTLTKISMLLNIKLSSGATRK